MFSHFFKISLCKILIMYLLLFFQDLVIKISHTFSILKKYKKLKNQEIFFHWMLENIDQTFQMSIQCFSPKKTNQIIYMVGQWSSHRIVKEVGIVGSMLYRNHCGNILNTKEVKATKHLKQRHNFYE